MNYYQDKETDTVEAKKWLKEKAAIAEEFLRQLLSQFEAYLRKLCAIIVAKLKKMQNLHKFFPRQSDLFQTSSYHP
ncbi:hypothetical protein BC351_39990 [Paenibacillus ferrarius]|uniref:Uncharacterized protein n=1 Tax=Paenibacillus ferrarius TaxID=1469647 RepID=A0A1V4H9E9_9BACL|nr:hypothetical protein BC351_39990 [Paenibacillus ferrarius]